MSVFTWIVGGFVAGWGLKKFFGSPPVKGSGGMPSVVATPTSGMFTILGRPTFIHAPIGATRMMVCFHGFSGNVVTMGPRLVKALGDASVAAVLPQLGPKSEPGDLATRMVEYLAAVKAKIGFSPVHTDGVSHSGGYRALAAMLRQTQVSGVGLLDSLYGEYPTFLSSSFYCMIDIYGSETAKLSEELRVDTKGDPRFQILRTSTMHDAMPEKYIGQMARAFPSCAKVTVT